MEKYYWDQNDLRKHLKALKQMLRTETNPQRIALIKQDLDLIKSMDSQVESIEPLSLLELYKQKKDFHKGLNFLESDISHFFEQSKNRFTINYPSFLDLNNTGIMTLTHDFYAQLDPFFYNHFQKCFDRRFDHTVFIEPDLESEEDQDLLCRGRSIILLSKQESYTEIYKNYTIYDILTIIHEYMHSIAALISPNHFSDKKKPYGEIDTLFIELLAIDYLENIFNNGDSLLAKLIDYSDRIDAAMNTRNFFKLMSLEDTEHGFRDETELSEAISSLKLPKGLQEDLLASSNRDEIYITSYLFAIELYELYKKDPEKAMHLLRLLIESNAKSAQGYYNSFINMGLHPNEHLEEFKGFLKDERLLRALKK